jgi:hypothetical protein
MKKTILFLLSVVFLSACSQPAKNNFQLLDQTDVVPGSDINVPADTLKVPVIVPGSGFNVPSGTLKEPVVVPESDPAVMEQRGELPEEKPL